MTNEKRLLIIDDDEDIRAFFRDVAEECGYDIAEASDVASVEAGYESLQPTAVLLDLTMPEIDGVEVLRDLANRKCQAAIFLASGQDERVLSTAQRLGRMLGLNMREGLQKPVAVADLETALMSVAQSPAAITPGRLEEAIAAGEITLHYQPKVDLQSRNFAISGSEALARWQHPELGLLPPAQFIEMAEENGLIGPMTEGLLETAIRQLADWSAAGLCLPVSVNLSPSQLTDLSLPDRIAALLRHAGVDPSLLVLEITEQTAMADAQRATDILTRLRLKNIAVSLDDFGAGYSSLIELYRMPLSELKIDRSLVMELDADPDARKVFIAINALAMELGLPLCVEGIETMKTAEFLRSIGCAKGQGYLFGKPMSSEDFAAIAMEKSDVSLSNRRTASR